MKAKCGGSAPNRLPFQVCPLCPENDAHRSSAHIAEAALNGSIFYELRTRGVGLTNHFATGPSQGCAGRG